MIKLKSLLREETEQLSSISQIDDTVKQQLAQAAQTVYDQWSQDADGNDEVFGTGGICDEIADVLMDVLGSHGIHDIQSQYNEPHTYVIGKFKEGIFTIDIPFSVYESGYLYTWKKTPNVKFEAKTFKVRGTKKPSWLHKWQSLGCLDVGCLSGWSK